MRLLMILALLAWFKLSLITAGLIVDNFGTVGFLVAFAVIYRTSVFMERRSGPE